jgi:SAM-dependent MidA family methyltransferase
LPIADLLIDLIHERGPLTVAAFMDLALYHSEFGYYARAAQRSGRAGDFFTSVDVGAMFGDLLEIQIAEMAELLAGITVENEGRAQPTALSADPVSVFELVEAGAGNGRLSADILRAARRRHPDLFGRTKLHLVEASAAARGAQPATLGEVAERVVSSTARLPPSFDGVLLANELIDAFPVHQVVMRPGGLREVYVDLAPDSVRGRAPNPPFVTREGPLSTPALAEYLRRLDITLEPGWRVEINLQAVDWIRDAAQRLRRGFIILIDYGHEASQLYGVTHAGGTLTTFARHTMAGAESGAAAPWLMNPGAQDITAHVDFTTLRRTAEAEGLATLGLLDQTYFLMGLVDRLEPGSLGSRRSQGSGPNPENPGRLENLENLADLNDRLALKTLLMPGGLGSALKVLLLGKGVGTPALRGCSYRMRVT